MYELYLSRIHIELLSYFTYNILHHQHALGSTESAERGVRWKIGTTHHPLHFHILHTVSIIKAEQRSLQHLRIQSAANQKAHTQLAANQRVH